MRNTVVELDLVNFTERARRVEALVGPEGVRLITEKVRSLALGALKKIKVSEKAIRKDTGDGLILVFKNPDDAHRFGVAFHESSDAENATLLNPASHYLFRLGVATGEIAEELGGTTIIDAVRLEGGGRPGEVLIDPATYGKLSRDYRNHYGGPERIVIKGKEKDGAFDFHRCVVVQPQARPFGWVTRKYVLETNKRIPDEVFAVELLQRPVRLRRDDSGLTVTVNREGVEEMLISNEGKRAAVARYIGSRERQEDLRAKDLEYHKFLAGREHGEVEVDPKELKIGLRWASGGILSIVTLAGDPAGKQWVPCFFRDIRPYGWNISLGATERWFTPENQLRKGYSIDYELNSPWEYILREFLEETLIVAETPSRGARMPLRPFEFRDESAMAVAAAHDFSALHRTLRKQDDDLEILPSAGRPIIVKRRETDCSLTVENGTGTAPSTRDVLVCFSLLDLGIEVIRAVEYEIDPTDTILDGEIQAKDLKHTGEPQNELVRMPIALLSMAYLREILHATDRWQTYTLGPQPSFVMTRPPDPERDEIRLYSWDVQRRMGILTNPVASHAQAARFLDWYDKFGPNFVDADGRPSIAHPSRLFVPSTAKALNLLFEQESRTPRSVR